VDRLTDGRLPVFSNHLFQNEWCLIGYCTGDPLIAFKQRQGFRNGGDYRSSGSRDQCGNDSTCPTFHILHSIVHCTPRSSRLFLRLIGFLTSTAHHGNGYGSVDTLLATSPLTPA
jgi:hypothetical protein